MDSRRTKNLRNNFNRTILNKQMDNFFQTGRQLVDGVSGARPGKRRNSDFQEISKRNFRNVGRWVTDKMDLFFDEDEDDWYDEENNYEERREMKSFRREDISLAPTNKFLKRPLEALSLRQPQKKKINEQKKLPYSKSNSNQQWPDDLDLKVDRWHRSEKKEINLNIDNENQPIVLPNGRNIPRSRRRRI